jgi:hypothetical protein
VIAHAPHPERGALLRLLQGDREVEHGRVHKENDRKAERGRGEELGLAVEQHRAYPVQAHESDGRDGAPVEMPALICGEEYDAHTHGDIENDKELRIGHYY